MRKGLVVLTVAVSGALSLGGPASASAGTLDQQQLVGTLDTYIDSTQSLAQTFTAGLNGNLDRVDLFLRALNTPTPPLTVEIRNVTADSPGSTVLAIQTVPRSAITGTLTFVPITFAVPASVAAGTRYAIVTYSASASPAEYSWAGSSSDVYAGGRGLYVSTSPPSGTWLDDGGSDHVFQTYVAPPNSSAPETVIGSKKIKGTTARFTFTSTVPGSSFQCKLDKRAFKPCSSPKRYKHLRVGKHKFRVRAVDAAGNVDPTPAKQKFKI